MHKSNLGFSLNLTDLQTEDICARLILKPKTGQKPYLRFSLQKALINFLKILMMEERYIVEISSDDALHLRYCLNTHHAERREIDVTLITQTPLLVSGFPQLQP